MLAQPQFQRDVVVVGRGGCRQQDRHNLAVESGGKRRNLAIGLSVDGWRCLCCVSFKHCSEMGGWTDGFSCQNPEARSQGGFWPSFLVAGVCVMLSEVALSLTALPWFP